MRLLVKRGIAPVAKSILLTIGTSLATSFSPLVSVAQEEPVELVEPTPPPPLSDAILNRFKVHNSFGLSGRILFTATIDDQERILLLDLDESKVRSVISGPGDNRYPTFSPDAEHFAFVSTRDGNSEIYVAKLGSPRILRITTSEEKEGDPAWSPDGKKLLFYRLLQQDGDLRTHFVSFPIKQYIQWLRDEAYARRRAVEEAKKLAETLPEEGEDAGELPEPTPTNVPYTPTGEVVADLPDKNLTPAWSPLGDRFAYSTNRKWPGWDVCLWSIPDKQESCILSGSRSFGRPDWSSDNTTVVASGGDARNMNLTAFSFTSRKLIQLTSLPGKEYDAKWVAGKQFIIFNSNRGNSAIYNTFSLKLSDDSVSPLLTGPYSIRFLSYTPRTTMELEASRINSGDSGSDPYSPFAEKFESPQGPS